MHVVQTSNAASMGLYIVPILQQEALSSPRHSISCQLWYQKDDSLEDDEDEDEQGCLFGEDEWEVFLGQGIF